MRASAAFAALAIAALAAPALADEDVLRYEGQITPLLVDRFIEAYDATKATRIVVSSGGGDVAAGIKLGLWIRKHGLDVEVFGQCESACANYVFPAGRRKIIDDRAVVTWHGSMQQKDIRELRRRYSALLEKAHDHPGLLTEDEKAFLRDKRVGFDNLVALQEAELAFYDLVGSSERLARLGQEPTSYGIDSFVATPRVMERFGLMNVVAPAGYATREYLDRTILLVMQGGDYLVFDLDPEGTIVRVPMPLRPELRIPPRR